MGINRITDSMMNYGFLSGMNKSLNAQYSLMEQMSDGKRIHRPSDDPVRVIRSMQYRSALVQNEQFKSNVQDAQSWMEITDSAMKDLSSLMTRAKELVVRAIAPNPTVASDATAKEIDGLINQAIQIANTKIGDRYIFAGQMDKTQPFERVLLSDPTGASNLKLDAVVYYGDDRKISMITQAGSVNPARDGINLTGIDVFGRTAAIGSSYGQATNDVFNKLIRIKEELEKTTAVKQTNVNGGALTVDGHYAWPADFQDFAVKIDALKLQAQTYTQSRANGGRMSLSYTGNLASLPSTLNARIDRLKLNATVTSQNLPGAGALTFEATSLAALPANVRLRIDAVEVDAGTITRSNPLSGALTIDYDGYKGTPPSNLMVRMTGTEEVYNVTKSNAASGDLAVTAITGSAAAVSRVRITAVDGAGRVTAASYFDSASQSWKDDVTVAAVSPSTLTLGATGIIMEIDDSLGNTPNDEYAVTASKRASSVEYSVNGGTTWLTASPATPASPGWAASFISQSNNLGGAATVTDPLQATRLDQKYQVRVEGLDATGKVTAASVSTDNGNTWLAATVTAGGADATVALPGGVSMTIADSNKTAINDTYQYRVPPSFTLDAAGNDIGLKVSIASSVENNFNVSAATGNTYTIPLTATGKAMQASYSANGGPWVAATADNADAPLRFSLDAVDLVASIATSPDNLVSDGTAAYFEATGFASANQVSAMSYQTAAGVWTAATADAQNVGRFRFGDTGLIGDISANNVTDVGDSYAFTKLSSNGEAAALSYSTDRGNSWVSAGAPAISQSNALGGKALVGGNYTAQPTYENFQVKINALEVSGTITPPANMGNLHLAYSGALPVPTTLAQVRIDSVDANGKITGMSYDDGGGWLTATADPNVPGRYTLGATGMIASIDQDADNAALGTYAVTAATLASTGRPAIASYSLDGGSSYFEASPAVAITKSNVTGGDMSLTGSYAFSGMPPASNVTVKLTGVGTEKQATAIQYSLDGGATWSDSIAAVPSGSGRFALGDTGLGVKIDPAVTNKPDDTFSFAMSSATTPYAPALGLADGITLDIGASSANVAGDTYSFAAPSYFTIGDSGVKVNVQAASGNAVKDAYTFHMPQSDEGPDHIDLNLAVGPDMDWLSARGLADIETSHEQILRAYGETGARLSMYEMTATMLDNNYTSLVDSVAANEDMDMAKAIIDLKTAENSYKAALSFGARIMPTSLVDFLR